MEADEPGSAFGCNSFKIPCTQVKLLPASGSVIFLPLKFAISLPVCQEKDQYKQEASKLNETDAKARATVKQVHVWSEPEATQLRFKGQGSLLGFQFFVDKEFGPSDTFCAVSCVDCKKIWGKATPLSSCPDCSMSVQPVQWFETEKLWEVNPKVEVEPLAKFLGCRMDSIAKLETLDSRWLLWQWVPRIGINKGYVVDWVQAKRTCICIKPVRDFPRAARCLEPAFTEKLAEHIAAEKEVQKVKKTDDNFWKNHIVSRSMACACITETLESLKDDQDVPVGKHRFTEEAKKCVADCLEQYLEEFYHVVKLVTEHRDALTPKEKDYDLARTLTSPSSLHKSLEASKEAACAEPAMKRRRLRAAPMISDALEDSCK